MHRIPAHERRLRQKEYVRRLLYVYIMMERALDQCQATAGCMWTHRTAVMALENDTPTFPPRVEIQMYLRVSEQYNGARKCHSTAHTGAACINVS